MKSPFVTALVLALVGAALVGACKKTSSTCGDPPERARELGELGDLDEETRRMAELTSRDPRARRKLLRGEQADSP